MYSLCHWVPKLREAVCSFRVTLEAEASVRIFALPGLAISVASINSVVGNGQTYS